MKLQSGFVLRGVFERTPLPVNVLRDDGLSRLYHNQRAQPDRRLRFVFLTVWPLLIKVVGAPDEVRLTALLGVSVRKFAALTNQGQCLFFGLLGFAE